MPKRAITKQPTPSPAAPATRRVSRAGKQPARPSAPAAKRDLDQKARTTKQDRMLALLSRPAGASLDELVEASGWQTHSVRGFLSGTVKKKLGFALDATEKGDRRSYRIETRRGR